MSFHPRSEHELSALSVHWAKVAQDARQVARRVRELLPRRLQEIHRQKLAGGGLSAGRALRRALRDPEYLAHIEESVGLAHRWRQARVMWEVKRMELALRRFK